MEENTQVVDIKPNYSQLKKFLRACVLPALIMGGIFVYKAGENSGINYATQAANKAAKENAQLLPIVLNQQETILELNDQLSRITLKLSKGENIQNLDKTQSEARIAELEDEKRKLRAELDLSKESYDWLSRTSIESYNSLATVYNIQHSLLDKCRGLTDESASK